MSAHLSPLADPASLAKVNVLLVPVHTAQAALPHSSFAHWSSLFQRHLVLRGDELARPSTGQHQRGTPSNSPRERFLPSSSASSISRGGATNHVHLSYPSHPPARHLSALSLLRLSSFPLVVIGFATQNVDAQGYDVGETPVENDNDIKATGLTEGLSSAFSSTLADLFPITSPFPLAKRLVVVPSTLAPSTPRATLVNRHPGRLDSTGDDMVFAPTEGIDNWTLRLLGQVVGDALAELGELASSLESVNGLKTLSATLLPALTSTALPEHRSDSLQPGNHLSATPTHDLASRSQTSTPIGITTDDTNQRSVGISLTRALTPGGRPASVGPPSLPPIQASAVAPPPPPASAPQPAASSNPFRRSTALTSPFSRSSSGMSLASAAKEVNTLPFSTGTKYTSAPLGGLAGGRLLKLLGDMYLLAGMYSDAAKCYDDGAERCRTVGDVLWEGVAREGRAVAGLGEAWEGRDGSNISQPFPTCPVPVEILTHLLSSLACLSRSPLPYPPTILSPSPQAVSGIISFPAPSSHNPSSIGTGEGLLAFLHTSLALRISHFLLIIWASGGWGSIALSSLLSHTLPRSFPLPLSIQDARDPLVRRKRNRTLALLGGQSLLSRHSIFDHAEAAIGPHSRAMTSAEQLQLHVQVVWLARWLDMPRKEASATRELVKRIAITVVEARDETRRLARGGFVRESAPVLDPGAVGLGLGMAIPKQAVAVKRKEPTQGNTGVMALFERALTLMGVDLLDLSSNGSSNSASGADTVPNAFGWPELQVEMLKEGIAVAEALPDNLAVVRLCISALNRLYMHLSPHSQSHVSKMYPGALGTLQRRGQGPGQLPWWIPGKIVLSIELASLPANRLPIEHSKEEIAPLSGQRDPFLYNPRLKAAQAGKMVVVANEQTEVFVTLQNPFSFNLEIQDLSLLTLGVPFVTSPLPLSLPSNSVQTIRVTGIPSVPGSLQLCGVTLRLADGSATSVVLPVLGDSERVTRDKRQSKIAVDEAKVKHKGMDARWSLSTDASRERDETRVDDNQKWLECRVVEEQPLVWIKKTNLTHGAVMLYDGESSTIRITLENSSNVTVDFIKLSFEDSCSRAAHSILNEGKLAGEQAYELEYDMVNRPVFSWSGEQVPILPGGRTTLSVSCLGKVGCTDGLVRIDYGSLNRDPISGEAPKAFHTRQISFPVLFTVYHTLEPHHLDLVRIIGTKTEGQDGHEGHDDLEDGVKRENGRLALSTRSGTATPLTSFNETIVGDALKADMDDRHCLVGLSVRNSYGVPFQVCLRLSERVSTSRLVPPGATEWLFLPVPRRSLAQVDLAQPIPKLSDRQYVVEKTNKSAYQVSSDRELFWYRESLLDSLQATWVEPGTGRSGTMSLRNQVLTDAGLAALKLDDLEVEIEAVSTRNGGDICPTDFVDLVVTVTNHLERAVRPYIRLEPLASFSTESSWASTLPASASASAQGPGRQPSSGANPPLGLKNVVFDGSLSGLLAQRDLGPGSSAKWEIGAVFLTSGEFGFRAAVELVPTADQTKDNGQHLPVVRFSPLLRVKVA